MGVLIVLGTAVVVGTVVHRLYAKRLVPSMPAMAPAVQGGGAANAGLAPGEHIAGIASAGGDVAIWVTGPRGDRLLLLDPASGGVSEVLGAPK